MALGAGMDKVEPLQNTGMYFSGVGMFYFLIFIISISSLVAIYSYSVNKTATDAYNLGIENKKEIRDLKLLYTSDISVMKREQTNQSDDLKEIKSLMQKIVDKEK